MIMLLSIRFFCSGYGDHRDLPVLTPSFPARRSSDLKALGADRADNMLARITPPTRSNKLEMLKWMEAKEISRIVENEHPQIMALVLAHLDPPVAAEVLQLQIGRAHV